MSLYDDAHHDAMTDPDRLDAEDMAREDARRETIIDRVMENVDQYFSVYDDEPCYPKSEDSVK